jgi:ATP-binding cassette subfamily C protein CydC
MSVLDLSRWQFGITTVYHFIFVPLTIGLALLAAGVLGPLVAAASARRAARRAAAARGELGGAVTDLLGGAAELVAFGAVRAGLDRAGAADAELTRLARRSASASGLGTGLAAAVSGLTLWGVLLLGVAATGSGSLGRAPLAVITLTALAAFEAVTALPAAALHLGHARAAADRIADVLDAPEPVPGPDRPFPPPVRCRPVHVVIRGGSVRYPGQSTTAVRDIDLDLPPGRRVALVGPAGAGKSTIAAVLFRFLDLSSGTALLTGRDLSGYDPDDVRTVIGGCAADLEGLDQVDEIVVLCRGRVAERGSHAQLVRAGGTYQRLWQARYGG